MSRTTRAVTTAVAALALSAGVVPAAQAAETPANPLTATIYFRDGKVADVFRPFDRAFFADTGEGVELLTFRGGRWTTAGNLLQKSFDFGRAGDVPVVGDWDGDGLDEPGVVRGNRYFLASEAVDGGGAVRTFSFGSSRMLHGVAGDWDGDGVEEPVAVTSAGRTGRFWFATEQVDGGGTPYARDWGRAQGDVVAAGDLDGDGVDSVVLQRASQDGGAPTFFVSDGPPAAGLRADEVLRYGRSGDLPLVAESGRAGGADLLGVVRERW
ncbi:hypothetical protein [uncultured Pseudokineococcus sp.]|uniref:hypothetical protein n=1 Tax=uncultured Pseudokineococcus sp. TaxID=1642928 RepID=UPI0026178AD5|nr:hypothetical protein [uncultured Pseudokineococcus sp.]